MERIKISNIMDEENEVKEFFDKSKAYRNQKWTEWSV